ncbi:hypothetical protein SSYRP_v1c06590 [Spiroplasma syrphidicola EA-1]|uniref:Uncharacterized protein n=1 Tax=Spiroplasma syrphidicola EA-1 TaxID=1276229 RepID=R4UEA8_9MOLU|nr:hypothetical protein [Spiroplasma syrphidicola]AGM26249.1 hypothetical protein SSYRP_v1c06590 [Spiroplasma syrphidicola EA-1]
MKSLLVVLSLLTTPVMGGVSSLLTSTENSIVENKAVETVQFKHTLDMSIFAGPGGTVIAKENDFSDSLIQIVEEQRQFLKENKIVDFKVVKGESWFNNLDEHGPININEGMNALLHAQNYQINNNIAKVSGPDEFGNYTFSLTANVTIDGETFDLQMDGFETGKQFADFQILGGFYNLYTLEYTIPPVEDGKKELYYNSNHTDETVSLKTPGFSTNRTLYSVVKVNVGKLNQDLTQYKKMDFLGTSSVSATWGSDSYHWNVQNLTPIFTNDNNYKIQNDNDIDNFATIEVVNDEQWGGLAYFDIIVKFGYTWYQENDNYYIQIVSKKYVSTHSTFSAIYSTINFSNGIRLDY